MPIFEGAFWKYVWPLLWTGSTGVGIKLYIRDGDGLDSGLINVVVPTVPADKTYKKTLEDRKVKLVTSSTSHSTLQEIFWNRIFPHHDHNIKHHKDSRFTGNPELTLAGKKYTNKSSKTIFIFEKSSTSDLDQWRNACIAALNEEHVQDGDESKKKQSAAQLIKLQAWCAESTVKDVLSRHKLTVLNTEESNTTDDENWKELIAGGWFVPKHKTDQSFLNETEWDTFLGSKKDSTGITTKNDVTSENIKTLKNKCAEILVKPFTRSTFHAPTAFIKDVEEKDKSVFTKVDEFQEAALFCTKPMSASDFVDKAMQGKTRTSLDSTRSTDFCYMSDKSIDLYKNVKTNEPFEGKTFWCAVSLVYTTKSGK